MPVDEPPVQAIHDLAPVAASVIAHLEQIIRPADVGLGREDAAVAEQPHAVHVRTHHPVRRVDVHLHEPAVRVGRMDLAQRHEVRGHHQAFDVMVPAQLLQPVNRAVQRHDARRAVVPVGRQPPFVAKEITRALLMVIAMVDTADELTPTDDLAHEPFE